MGFAELFIIAVSLSMDAFAVAICKGLSIQKLKMIQVITVGIYFGGFQAIMPIIAWMLGVKFQEQIAKIDN